MRIAFIEAAAPGFHVDSFQKLPRLGLPLLGTLLSLPNVGVRRRVFLEEEAFSYGLADFLTGVYPDRMESSAHGADVSIRLIFEA